MESARTVAAKRRILDAALDAFVLSGYLGTTTDEIAASAAASKQTVYKHFGDKEGLFRAIVDDIVAQVAAGVTVINPDDFDDGPAFVEALATRLADSILAPRVQRIRRLVIAEAARFPQVGLAYYEGSFELVLHRVGTALERAAQRGWLRIDDPKSAADQLAGLILWLPTNRIMMTGRLDAVDAGTISESVRTGISTFLSAYGT